jgi:predicted enzyme related to lactoylglutathione lyase
MAATPSHPPGTPNWADLQSPDPEGARRFYGELLGWTYDVMGPEFGNYAMCKVGSKIVAGLGGMPPGQPMPSSWTVYLATESVEATIEATKQNGGQAMMGPMDVGGAGRMAVLVDNVGAVFGVWQPLDFHGSELWNEAGAPAWAECYSKDAKRAVGFYTTVFGLQSQLMPGMEYHTLHVGDGPPQAGVMQIDDHFPPQTPSHWSVYISVPDADAAVRKIEALGGSIIHAAMDTPYGRLVAAKDPWGAMFRLIQGPAS